MKKLLLSLFIAASLTACVNDETDETIPSGTISFSISNISNRVSLAAKNPDPNIPDCRTDLTATSVDVIIQDEWGNNTEHNVNIVKLDGNTQTQQIKLPVGNYSIVSFMVIAEDGVTPMWAAPKIGSYFQELFNMTGVDPYNFSVAEYTFSKISLDVLCYEESSAQAFGYTSFEYLSSTIKEIPFTLYSCIEGANLEFEVIMRNEDGSIISKSDNIGTENINEPISLYYPVTENDHEIVYTYEIWYNNQIIYGDIMYWWSAHDGAIDLTINCSEEDINLSVITDDFDLDGVVNKEDFNPVDYFIKNDINNNNIGDYYDVEYFSENKSKKLLFKVTSYSHDNSPNHNDITVWFPHIEHNNFMTFSYDDTNLKWYSAALYDQENIFSSVDITETDLENAFIEFFSEINDSEYLTSFLMGKRLSIYPEAKKGVAPLRYIAIEK